ncbi:MAG: hypothetical protein AB8B86_07200 [Pseudomonadales bacterium]
MLFRSPIVLLPFILGAAALHAQDDAEPTLNEPPISEAELLEDFVDSDTAERCINLRRLDRSEVLGNQTIVFHMRGDDIFINRLRFRCLGLSKRDTIMFETRFNQLCNLDQVTVLNETGGRFMRGASCGLGLFHPIDQETVDLLKGNREKLGKAKRGKGRLE